MNLLASLGFTSSNNYLAIALYIHRMAKPTQHLVLGASKPWQEHCWVWPQIAEQEDTTADQGGRKLVAPWPDPRGSGQLKLK
jgi:hypothetical protein